MPNPYQYLPLFARLALERIDCDHTLRDAAHLDELLDAYAATHHERVEQEVRSDVHAIAARRFGDTFRPGAS